MPRSSQAGKDGVAVSADEQALPVGAGIDIGRRDPRQDGTRALADIAGQVVLGDQVLHDREHALVEGGVDHLAPARPFPVVQGHHDADDGVQGGQAVADGDAGPGRRAVGLAGDIAQAAHGLADESVAGPLRIGAGLAEARHPGHDQPGVAGSQGVIAHAPLFQGTGAEVLDEDVRLVDEGQGQLPAFRLAQVEGHRALVAPDHGPPGRQALGQGPAPLAHGIALARVLDLDHVRAEVAKDLPAEGPGDEGSHFDDPEVGQGAFHGGIRHVALRFRAADLDHVPISGNRLSDPNMISLFGLRACFALQTFRLKGTGARPQAAGPVNRRSPRGFPSGPTGVCRLP